jgi:hypothetical protein
MKTVYLILLCLFLCPFRLDAADSPEAKKEKAAKEDKKEKEKTIALHFRPKEKVRETPKHIPEVKIFFETFRDERPNPREIGENLENKDKRIVILTADEHGAAGFVQSVLKEHFRNKGFQVEENPSGEGKILRGSLVKFWTVEEKRYRSEVLVKLEVRDKANHLYYQRTYAGEGSNFGRSLSEGNYQESISESLARMMDHLFSDADLIKALAERPRPARAEEKAPPTPSEAGPAKEKPVSTPSMTKRPTGAKPQGPVFGPK